MLAELLEETQVIVCLGPGGVGKTTTAAALAMAVAMKGKRVAVLTVDPAARLKDALDLPQEPGQLHRVPLPEGASGSLDALLLDAKGLFDDLVRRLSGETAVAEAILENPIYKNVAGAFAGSDSYMALEQLLDIAQDDRFDVIIVDTPPASSALELFDAPDRVLALLESPALDYLSEPMRILGDATGRLAQSLVSGVLQAIERLTGVTLVSDMSRLATDFGGIAPGFRERAHEIRDLLQSQDTRYVLVSAPDPHMPAELLEFATQVDKAGIPIDAVVLNRLLSTEHLLSDAPTTPRTEPGRETKAAEWSATLARKLVRCNRELGFLQDNQARILAELRAGMDQVGTRADTRLWVPLPALNPAPTTLQGVSTLASLLAATDDPAIRAD